MPVKPLLLFLALSGFAAQAEMMTINSTARALGMGDAYMGLADDSSSLFYNPAGLARVSGLNLKIFGLRAGASGMEAYEKIKDLNGDDDEGYANALRELYGEHVWSGVGGETSFTMPMIGFAVYNHLDALIQVDNPVYPEIYTSVVNDYGYVLGFGVPIAPVFHLGANFKYVKRSGARVPYGASFVADLDPDAIYDNVTRWGKGYGVDLGANFVIPAPFFSAVLSGTWKNVGEMAFKSNDPNTNIPSEKNDVSVGVALSFDTPLLSVSPAVDVRYLNREDLQLTRKLNFGIEIGVPLLDIRGGFHEGYYTAGAGVNLGLFQVDVATYGVELGAYPGQIEDRRYVVEFSMELGVGGFTATSLSGGKVAGAKGGDSASGGSGGGSRKSFWGGRRLKQRR
jgi:hypothetical protein